MIWLGEQIDGPMALARAVHFASAAMAAGAPVFRAAIAEPALRKQPEAAARVQSHIRRLMWIGLPILVASGLIWVMLLTESLSNEGMAEAVMSGALRDVLTLTQFGNVMLVRFGLAVALAIFLAFDRAVPMRRLALGAALALVASLAWTGHAASTPHALGYLHLAADVLHLCAAAGWIGGLVPLALLFRAGRQARAPVSAAAELEAARRFSALGIACVAALILSGSINAWILVGSVRGLIDTTYGWVLMAKLAVFSVMLAFAAINRFHLTPKLAGKAGVEARGEALRRLARNSVIEVVLGFVIFAIVGVLGMLHPAVHLMGPH